GDLDLASRWWGSGASPRRVTKQRHNGCSRRRALAGTVLGAGCRLARRDSRRGSRRWESRRVPDGESREVDELGGFVDLVALWDAAMLCETSPCERGQRL